MVGENCAFWDTLPKVCHRLRAEIVGIEHYWWLSAKSSVGLTQTKKRLLFQPYTSRSVVSHWKLFQPDTSRSVMSHLKLFQPDTSQSVVSHWKLFKSRIGSCFSVSHWKLFQPDTSRSVMSHWKLFQHDTSRSVMSHWKLFQSDTSRSDVSHWKLFFGVLRRVGSWHWSVLPLYPGYHKTVCKIITTSDSLLIKKRKSTQNTATTSKYWVTVWLTPGVSGIQPMTWGQASGISWHRLSPRENYFRSAVQNVPKAFNVLPDILMSGNV